MSGGVWKIIMILKYKIKVFDVDGDELNIVEIDEKFTIVGVCDLAASLLKNLKKVHSVLIYKS